MTLETILTHIDREQPTAVKRLSDLLRIPSVSTDPAFAKHCASGADWVAGQLNECGLRAKVMPTGGHPAVLARYNDAPEGSPRLLFYGHYDVQPPDPLDLWTTPPFEPTVRDGKLYARGASDDKGQVMCFVESLRAWKQVNGKFPINLTLLIEGEEECGSINLERFIREHNADLAADVCAVSDTAMWSIDTPAITYALRGLIYFEVKLFGPNRDLHSGVYGGSVPNPATELALVLGQLFDKDHRVTLPGFYDDVAPLTDEERRQWTSLGFDEKKYADSLALPALLGEKGFTALERRWARPTCDINGLFGGYMGEGAKTVIPSFAGAKVSCRLVANQDPLKIDKAFRAFFESRTPTGCRWQITQFSAAPPVSVRTDTPAMSAAKKAVQTAFGKPPVLIREGGSIPVVATFKKLLGLDTLLIGFGLNDDNLHSPNEKFDLINFHRGIKTYAALLAELAR